MRNVYFNQKGTKIEAQGLCFAFGILHTAEARVPALRINFQSAKEEAANFEGIFPGRIEGDGPKNDFLITGTKNIQKFLDQNAYGIDKIIQQELLNCSCD